MQTFYRVFGGVSKTITEIDRANGFENMQNTLKVAKPQTSQICPAQSRSLLSLLCAEGLLPERLHQSRHDQEGLQDT